MPLIGYNINSYNAVPESPAADPFAADTAAVRNTRPGVAVVAVLDQLAHPSWGTLLWGIADVDEGWDVPPCSSVVAAVEGHSSRLRVVAGAFLGVQILPGVGDSWEESSAAVAAAAEAPAWTEDPNGYSGAFV